MYRPTLRIASASSLPRILPRPHVARRHVSTAPPHHKSRSWKSSAARWGLAAGLVYYYNTSTALAEEPYSVHAPPETSQESEGYPTVASISEQRRAQSRSQSSESPTKAQSVQVAGIADAERPAPGSPGDLEEEASQEGAFNEETGEINWDCPCLGGMATGPCGDQFKAAFSCFVYSKEEPKGVECIDHFKAMQDCFREHPEVYGAELEDDEPPSESMSEEAKADQAAIESEPAPSEQQTSKDTSTGRAGDDAAIKSETVAPSAGNTSSSEPTEHLEEIKRETTPGSAQFVDIRHHPEAKTVEDTLPKAWHDSTDANTESKSEDKSQK